MPLTLIAVVIANSWIKTPGWKSDTSKQALSAFWVPIGDYWVPFGQNLASYSEILNPVERSIQSPVWEMYFAELQIQNLLV